MRRGPSADQPLGLRLGRTARLVGQAFERALAEAGGSAALWQVLLLVRSHAWGTQSRLAEALGITGATLTHHLNAAERQGLVRRWREPENRRVQRVELTPEGVALFERLRDVAGDFDERLRSGFDPDELEQLARFLDRIRETVDPGAPRA